MRIIGCDNQSTPKSGHIDVSNAFNGPWLKVKEFTCPLAQGNKNDFFFTPLKTRFIRVFISDNYGGDDIRIQGIGFYGVDMRLVNLLREYELERSLHTLLANGINDQETLDEKRDEILNSSDKYLDVNDHFRFIRLTEALRSPKLTFLEWFNHPQPTAIAGEKLQTFSAAGDEGVTDRVRLEEKFETNPHIKTVLMRDLEPIQGRSLVDFPDYVIKDPGRYKIRVVSVASPDVQTQWQDIVVGAKPPIVTTQTTDGLLPIPIPRRPSSTDIEAEIGHIPPFNKSRPFRRTPGPYPHKSSYDNDEDEDSDQMHRLDGRRRPPNVISQKLIDEGTQSEQKSTRNVGTMHEPVKTRNFGNEVQPQSSSTQTSFPSQQQKKPSPSFVTYIERPDHSPPPFDTSYSDQRTRCRSPHPYREDSYYDQYGTRCHDRSKRRSPSPLVPPPISDHLFDRHGVRIQDPSKRRSPSPTRSTSAYVYDRQSPYYDIQYTIHSHHLPSTTSQEYHHTEIRRRSPSSPEHQRKSPPPVSYRPQIPLTQDRPPTSIYRARTTSPQRRPHTPSPPRQTRSPSPYRRPHSAVPTHRAQMSTKQTDTSLDAMKRQQHAGVQSDPRSTRETGTTPSVRIKKPTSTHHSLDTSTYSQHKYRISQHDNDLLSKHDRSNQNYYIHSTINDNYRDNYQQQEEEEEETPSMHDQSTMAELLVSFDHYTQCESQPFMADRYIQTTPVLDEDEHGSFLDYPEESVIKQLSRLDSISVQQPFIIQPDTLPRSRRPEYSSTRSKRDGLDYTGNILEVSLHHGQQQRTTSIPDSPILNIGTEHVIPQISAVEYSTPFETRYVYEPNYTSTLRSRSSSSILMPVINSSRTHMFEKGTFRNSSAHQSRSNGNFYLSTAPPRSLNSSFHIDVTAKES